ncbi:MAG TPA: amidohydrolase family protein [Vicinamibacterales bacterium]|nr:amidohydrolase family protein [Vicinamibacterales bacterium]
MRTTRRMFLTEAAGLVFVGCSLADAAAQSSQRPAGSRRVVTIKGRRITTVDMHAHCAVPRASELLRRAPAAPTQTQASLLALEGQPLAQRLAAMDAQGIDVAVLSINPNWYDADRDLAANVIALQNEAMAAFCAAHADRFAALASVALQFPDLAASQLEQAMKQMGLRGAAIGGSVAAAELADPKFHPFWAKAEELGAVVFIHPQGSGSAALADRLKGNGLLGNVIGNPLETTIALSHLIFEGTLDRFPRLKICAAHGGGYLPSYMSRSDHGCQTFPTQCTAGVPKLKPTEYVKRIYYDSLVFTPEALRHLAAEAGADRIVMGTDYPYPWVDAPVDHVMATPGLSDAEREAILGGTARRLLGLTART